MGKPAIETEEDLEENLSRPSPAVVEVLTKLDGDVIVVGAGGKMGPTLARMARRALDRAGSRHGVVAVARFSDPASRHALDRAHVRTIACDLLDRSAVDELPDAAAVIYMAGAKFGTSGTSGAASRTWATNCYAAALAAERYVSVPTVVFSTGNVYPLVPVESGGATEATPVEPIGEYAQSALGRERLFEFFSRERGTPAVMFRLNYAVELRYGVLVDLATKVFREKPIDLRMGYVNCIWQTDANAAALCSIPLASSPPLVLNVTGLETIAVRALAERFGRTLGKSPVLEGEEEDTALLSNAALAAERLGPPPTSLDTAIEWVADWVRRDGRPLAKPTHFETRDGQF